MRGLRVAPTAATTLPGDEPMTVASPAGGPRDPSDDVTLPGVVGAVTATAHGRIVEVVVDGWRFELVVEPASRAALRDRARRDDGPAAGDGAQEIRAIIPGRVLTVLVNADEVIRTGQPVLVLEAMKMQNELRAPRDGIVRRIAVEPGRTVELGDLLLVLE